MRATKETKQKVNARMRNDRLLNICELFAAVRIGKLAVISIVVELGYRKVCATWAPKMITVKIRIRKKMPKNRPFRKSTAQ